MAEVFVNTFLQFSLLIFFIIAIEKFDYAPARAGGRKYRKKVPQLLFGQLANIYPRGEKGVFFKLGNGKLDSAACASCGGEYGFEAL